MTQWTLIPYRFIDGVSSVSGLSLQHPQLYLIADNSSYVYQYHIEQHSLNKLALEHHAKDRIAKPLKYDFESVVHINSELMLFGSGSKPTRLQCYAYNLHNGRISQTDLSQLYSQFKQIAALADDELNIEGVVFIKQPLEQLGGEWWFFQRGNGAQGCNGIFILHATALTITATIEFIPIDLPKIQQVNSSFTDAVLVDDAIYFLAAAENADSTYDDGAIAGSAIGKISVANRQLEWVVQISDTHKFEGITLFEQTDEQVIFLLGEDNDQHDAGTMLYQLNITV